MSYDIYMNKTYAGPMASIHGWDAFMDWAETLNPRSYSEIIRLGDEMISSRVAVLARQLDRVVEKDRPPKGLLSLIKRLRKATEKRVEGPRGQRMLWVTDGVNGLINEMIDDDDPDHQDPDQDDDA